MKKKTNIFRQKGSSSKLARVRRPKISQNIYKSIKLKVSENRIDRVIKIDVVKKSLQRRGYPSQIGIKVKNLKK